MHTAYSTHLLNMMPETNPILLEYPFLNGLANCQSVRIPLDHLHRNMWRLADVFTSRESERSGDEMSGQGLHSDLSPLGFHFTFSGAGRPEGV